MIKRIIKIAGFIRDIGVKNTMKLYLARLFSIRHYYILKCKLSDVPQSFPGRIPKGNLKMIENADILQIKRQISELNSEDKREVVTRLNFYMVGFKHCYVFKINDTVAYMQWIVYPSENDIISTYYRNKFKPLTPKQVLIENAFTFPQFRGIGILPYVKIRLLNIAKDEGYHWAMTQIKIQTIAAMNASMKFGFKIHKLVREINIFGRSWRNN